MAKPEPRRWGQAVFGGLMVALGGALFGVGRSGRPAAKPAAKAKISGKAKAGRSADKSTVRAAAKRTVVSQPNVRTKPRVAAAPARTRYWPPPPPKPIGEAGDGSQAEAKPADRQSVKLGYERFDAKPGTIVTVMLASAAVIALSITGLFYLIDRIHRSDRQGPRLTEQQSAVIVPPGPRLQDHPLHDIAMERKRETDLLTFYAWADPQHRTARIPIARAQALVTGRPLDPLPPAPDAAPPAAPSQP